MGKAKKIKGSNLADTIIGDVNLNKVDDKIDGRDGDDEIFGMLGDDDLKGGNGNDSLFGGVGDDKMKGGDGDDILDGGDGNDDMKGGDGADMMTGGAGDDKMKGGDGDDTMDGGAGDDKMTGGAGADMMHGGDGNDRMFGDGSGSGSGSGSGDAVSFDDYLDGGAGNDWMVGGAGADSLLGGEGDDVLFGDEGGSGGGWYKGKGSGSGKMFGSGSGSGSGSGGFDDYLDGGAGNDIVLGGGGNDWAVHTTSENEGATDDYRGGRGIDTLALTITAAQWADSAVQDELTAYQAHIDANTNATTGEANSAAFEFTTLGLTAREFENFEVTIESGPMDILAVGHSYYNDNGGMSIMQTNEDGTISDGVVFSSGIEYGYYYYYYNYEYNYAVAAGDFNEDGNMDYVAGGSSYQSDYYGGNGGDAEGISVGLGNGDGTFGTPTTYDSGTGYSYNDYYYSYYNESYEEIRDVEVGDLNGDGHLDIVASGYGYTDDSYYIGTGDGMTVLLGNGDGTFNTATTYALDADQNSGYYDQEYGYDLDLADMNGDGILDAVVGGYNYDYYAGYQNDSLSVMIGNGDGTFQTAVNYASGIDSNNGSYEETYTVATGDIDNDGDMDVVAGGYARDNNYGAANSTSILLGDGAGGLGAATTIDNGVQYYTSGSYTYNYTYAVELVDVNGDGNLDLISGGYDSNYYNSGSDGGLSVMMGNGDGTFATADVFKINPSQDDRIWDIEVGDVNFDGFLDIVVGDVNSGTFMMAGHGDGTFDAAVALNDGFQYGIYDLVLADFGDAMA